VEQTQVKPEKGYDFASALRAAMRQDPDIILVGEIRDSETANTAVQAALTGHLVFSTLHTNDAAGIVPRLLEMGIDAPTVASALNLAISQRLLRRLCKNCAQKANLSPDTFLKIKNSLENISKDILPKEILNNKKEIDISKLNIFESKGCDACYNTGYKGRIGIYEMFKITNKIGEVITTSPSIFDMRRTIIKEGMMTMQQDGLLRVLEGVTDLEELERVTGPLE
jgi:type IV pilus assembly protein PilB